MNHHFKRKVRLIKIPIFIFTCIVVWTNSLQASPPYLKLSIGTWRGEILRNDGNRIPFNFQTRKFSGKTIIYIINGTERMLVDNIRQSGDSLFIDMPFFDSHFALRIVNERKLEGNWIKYYGKREVVVPFQAIFNNPRRFSVTHIPFFNISGRWTTHFKGEKDSTEAIGEFWQKGFEVRGTFLTTTGDYRFLEGVVDGDTLKLSTFDGGNAYLFISIITDTNKIRNGFYYSGAEKTETWFAEKNEVARLPNEFSLSFLKDSSRGRLQFKFPDLYGHMVALSDPTFKNKVVVVQILGSWCPNCMDETQFLSTYYSKNKSRGVEIVGLTYERTTSLTDAKRLLQPFITRFKVEYPILTTGVSSYDSLRTEKTIPEINKIIGFPTTIIIDKKGLVRKIHTGFNGPGTGVHYDRYRKEFNDLMDLLLKE